MAESFGVDAAGYDRSRPKYPQPLIDRILATSPGWNILDVGIGTGIVARQLRHAGARLTGVEPDPRMADFARADGIDVDVATFEEWEPAGRSYDAVVAGMTWHWVDPDAGAAKAAQVLRPGGRVAIFWSAGDAPEEVNRAFAQAFTAAVPDWPGQVTATPPSAAEMYNTLADRAAAGFDRLGGFDSPERWQDAWDQPYSRDEYLALLPTQGTLTRVTPEQSAPILDAVGTAIDRLGGSFVMHYVTTTMTTIKSSGRTADDQGV